MFAAFMANSIGGKLAFAGRYWMATKPTAVLSLADLNLDHHVWLPITAGVLIICCRSRLFCKISGTRKSKSATHAGLLKSTFRIPLLAAVFRYVGHAFGGNALANVASPDQGGFVRSRKMLPVPHITIAPVRSHCH